VNRAHKTTQAEFRASLGDGTSLRRLSAKERREKYGAPAEFMPDDEIPFGMGRSSDYMPGVGADLSTLDGLLERHGFAKVLRSLRELCDARTGHDCGGLDSFEAVPDEKEWQANGDALETLLVRLARGQG
jgi:hypothetical protein